MHLSHFFLSVGHYPGYASPGKGKYLYYCGRKEDFDELEIEPGKGLLVGTAIL